MLEAKVREVEALFSELDAAIADFQKRSTLHCRYGCGKCCFKPDIEATVLEFIPFAWSLHKKGEGELWLEKLATNPSSLCVILDPARSDVGLCTQYASRGLICRLFGYSARTNKYNQKELVTCQVIKTEQAPAFEGAVQQIAAGEKVPVMNEFYMRLHSIDADLTRDFFPINVAIRKAIELVLHYFAYRSDDAAKSG